MNMSPRAASIVWAFALGALAGCSSTGPSPKDGGADRPAETDGAAGTPGSAGAEGNAGAPGSAGSDEVGGAAGTAGAAGAAGAGGTTVVVTPGDSVLMHHNHLNRDGVYVQPLLTKTAAAG